MTANATPFATLRAMRPARPARLAHLAAGAALTLCVLAGAPALAQEHEGDGAAAEGEAHEGEHGGPVTLEGILHNPEFWTAALNFSLLVVLLRRFGKAPLADFLSGRRKQMEQAINEAAAAKAAAEGRLKEYNDRLAQLDQELAKLRADLVAAGEEDKKRIVADAEENARRTKRETEALVDQHAKQLVSQVRSDLIDAAVAAAEQLVRAQIGPADQQRLADSYRQQIAAAPRATRGGGMPS